MSEFCPADESGGLRSRVVCGLCDGLGQAPGALPGMVDPLERGPPPEGLGLLLEPGVNLTAHQPAKPPADREQRWSVHQERDLLDGLSREPVRESLAYNASEVVQVATEEGWEMGERSLALSAVEPPNRDRRQLAAITLANTRPFVASPALRYSPALPATALGPQAF